MAPFAIFLIVYILSGVILAVSHYVSFKDEELTELDVMTRNFFILMPILNTFAAIMLIAQISLKYDDDDTEE